MEENRSDELVMKVVKEYLYHFHKEDDVFTYVGRLQKGVLKFLLAKNQGDKSYRFAYYIKKNLNQYFYVLNPSEIEENDDAIIYYIGPKTELSFIGDEDQEYILTVEKNQDIDVFMLEINLEVKKEERKSIDFNPDSQRDYLQGDTKFDSNIEEGYLYSLLDEDTTSLDSLKEQEEGMFNSLLNGGK